MANTVIGIDVGYGNTKAVWGHSLDKAGRERWGETCFRSIAPLATIDEESMSGGTNPDRIRIEMKDKHYYAGPAAALGIEARGLDPNYIESDEHEVLLRASLYMAMREKGEVFEEIDMLVVGLPVSGFSARGKRLREIALLEREVPSHRICVAQEFRPRSACCARR